MTAPALQGDRSQWRGFYAETVHFHSYTDRTEPRDVNRDAHARPLPLVDMTVIPLPTLYELFEYNYWAQNRQLEACSVLTREQFLRPLGGSFPSLRDTFGHLVDGEEYALHRWQGHSRQEIVDSMGFSSVDERLRLWPEQFPSFPAVGNRAKRSESEVRQ